MEFSISMITFDRSPERMVFERLFNWSLRSKLPPSGIDCLRPRDCIRLPEELGTLISSFLFWKRDSIIGEASIRVVSALFFVSLTGMTICGNLSPSDMLGLETNPPSIDIFGDEATFSSPSLVIVFLVGSIRPFVSY